MDNTYKNNGNMRQPDPVNAALFKMPKNIRQVGNITSHNKIIYIEDYVMTFIKQLSDKDHSGCGIAVLLGYYIRTEEGRNIFVKAAVEMQETENGDGIGFTDEGWTSIYENIKKYFTDVEIVGWALIGPEFFIESGEKIRKVHIENFPGPDKILLKMDSLEKEETFYINENNQLMEQNGYYIYYEKNEEMQNYMVDHKQVVSEERTYNDQTTRKIRSVIQEKKEVKDDKSVVRLLYAASTLLAIVVLVIAATMLDNYEQMKNMEVAINQITESLSLVKENNQGDTQVAEDSSSDTLEEKDTKSEIADSESVDTDTIKDENILDIAGDLGDPGKDGKSDDTMDVETISGNVVVEDDTSSNEENLDQEEAADNESQDESTNQDNDEDVADDSNTNKNSNKPDKDNDKSSDNDASTKDESTQTDAKVNYYIVREGDSLVGICFDLYNSTSNLSKIMELNGIDDQDKIFIGQKLIVP
jgi:hypothetical protein